MGLYPSEHDEQAAYFRWLNLQASFPDNSDLLLPWSVPNERRFRADPRSRKIIGQRFKAEGMKKGVPDVTFPIPRYPYHGLYIEFKSKDPKAKVSDDQEHYREALNRLGYLSVICYGCDHAIKVTTDYLKLPQWSEKMACW